MNAATGWRSRLGVCSWSLQPAQPGELVERVVAAGLRRVQLWLDPLRAGAWRLDETRRALAEAGIAIGSGMMMMAGEDYSSLASIRATGGVRPDATWAANLAAARGNARVAAELGLSLVTFHAGFLPEDSAAPEYETMRERLRQIAAAFADEGVHVGLESGQESAETLLRALRELDCPSVGVNFDPANLLLYGVDEPVAALRRLAPHVVQMHIKDAAPSATPGEWGAECVVGTGAVDWVGLLRVMETAGLAVPLMIEREAGEQRVADVAAAVAHLANVWPEGAA